MPLALAGLLALLAPWPAFAQDRPAVKLGLRLTAGADEALASGGARLYRAQPGIAIGVRPARHLDIVAGAGVGAAYVVRPPRGGVELAMSGMLGVRFPVEGANVLATARVEAVTGSGAAVSLHLETSFDRAR
jgi:hypothetical protein